MYNDILVNYNVFYDVMKKIVIRIRYARSCTIMMIFVVTGEDRSEEGWDRDPNHLNGHLQVPQ